MNAALLIYDFRRLTPWWLVSLIGLWALYLLLPGPLRQTAEFSLRRFIHIGSGLVFSVLVFARIFSDTESTSSFVFSRGIKRRDILFTRIFLAVAVIVTTSTSLWMLLSAGVRTWLHQQMNHEDAAFYPSVARFESPLAIDFCTTSLLVLCLCIYYWILRGIHAPGSTSTSGAIARMCVLEIPAHGILILTAILTTKQLIPDHLQWAIGLIVATLCVYVSFRGCEYLEVDA